MAGILMLLLVMLLSCRSSDSGSSSGWKTYRNPRYNFEFPYPSNWSPFPMPDNLDGQAFRDPQNPTSEIRGWAAQNALKEPLTPQQPNFTTEQGVRGKLQVEVGADISLMTLTLSQGKVRYNWQGQCESEQFPDCYRLFHYVARQYRIPPPEKGASEIP